MNFWDVGGNKDLLSLWDRYIEDCHAIVFVVDSCGNEESYELCLQALSRLFLQLTTTNLPFLDKVMSFEKAKQVPLMILFNKCDQLDVHLPLSASASSVQDEEMDDVGKPSSSSTTANRSEPNGSIMDEGNFT